MRKVERVGHSESDPEIDKTLYYDLREKIGALGMVQHIAIQARAAQEQLKEALDEPLTVWAPEGFVFYTEINPYEEVTFERLYSHGGYQPEKPVTIPVDENNEAARFIFSDLRPATSRSYDAGLLYAHAKYVYGLRLHLPNPQEQVEIMEESEVGNFQTIRSAYGDVARVAINTYS